VEVLKRKLYNNLAVGLFAVAAVVVLIITVYTGFLIDSFSSVFRKNIEERLLAVVRSAVSLVSPGELERLQTPEDMESTLFSELRMRLVNFGREHDILFVYYIRPIPGGMAQFIIDNDLTFEAVNLASDPIPMEPALFKAVEDRTAVTTLLGEYSEGYAGLLSAYAPVVNRRGEVAAVAGVDITDENLIFTRRRFRLLSVMLIAAMAFTLTSGLASFFIYKKNEDVFAGRLKQQELMSSLAASFVSDKETPALVNDALRMTGEFLNVDRMAVGAPEKDFCVTRPAYFWKKGGGEFVMPGLEGFNDLLKSSFPLINPGTDIIILFCNDVDAHEKYGFMKTAGVRAFMWVPLYVDGKFWAVLEVEHFSGRLWTNSDRQLISTMASVIAGAAARERREKERDAAREAAEKASKAKSDFLANMSHEMRTPMNAVIGMTAIAKNSRDIEKKDYCLDKIEDASTHLLGVINDLLDMSKIEANKFELSPVEFDFEKMLQKVVNVSSFRVDEKKQRFTVFIDKHIPSALVGDDQRLAQVIANLVSNAVKFTPEEGSIHLDTRLEEERGSRCTIKISVADSGIGISAEQKRRLFTSFEQADSSTSRKFGGTGLGLAISKRIVEMMEGSIWVESEPGKGSTFGFTVTVNKGTEERKGLLRPGVNWSNIRILVVDDDKNVREYFGDVAERFGVSCTAVAGGEEALELIGQKGPYDIYFIDWKMPGMDGMELTRRIKELSGEDTKSVVTMISATEWAVIEDEAKGAGVDKFVSKPLFPSAIADCINQCIGSEQAIKQDQAGTDDFSGRRIILAEDIEINREILMSLLEPTNISIDCAANGKEALDLFTENPYRYGLIFMDVQMPEMDGYEATRRIRAFEAQMPERSPEPADNGTEHLRRPPRLPGGPPGVPIIAMTANVFREDVEKCLEAGMNGHVGKPLEMDEVLGALRKYLS
jgi:signal transduction histidine kinase/CheY-like chemotaxis protein